MAIQYIATKNKSYGMFGLYNMQWEKPPLNDKMQVIFNMAIDTAREMRKEDSELTKEESIKQAWKSEGVLRMVANYRRDKQSAEDDSKLFIEDFKRMVSNPKAIWETDVPDAEVPIKLPAEDNEMKAATAVIESVINDLEEVRLAKMVNLGDE